MLIAGAAAQIAFEAVTDLFLGGCGLRSAVGSSHDHARVQSRTASVLVPERFLHRVQLAISGQAFVVMTSRPSACHGEHCA